MPDMDGAEVAARLKEDSQTKDIPVIFLTCLITKTEEGSGKRYHDATGHLFVAKPYDMEELISHIAALIPKPALMRNSIFKSACGFSKRSSYN
jgi:CheY-like chemotaxis protein